VALFKVPSYEEDLAEQLAALLEGLTVPSTHFQASQDAHASFADLEAHSLLELGTTMGRVAQLCLRHNVISTVVPALIARGPKGAGTYTHSTSLYLLLAYNAFFSSSFPQSPFSVDKIHTAISQFTWWLCAMCLT
jgi:hypothetical protein